MTPEQWENTKHTCWTLIQVSLLMLAACGAYELIGTLVHGHCL